MGKLKTKRPNIKTHIAIYYGDTLDSGIANDPCIKELLELCGSFDFAMNFTYAIYADHHMISNNMMIPIFHSYYLNSDPKVVILRDPAAIDVFELYPYHTYYLYVDKTNEKEAEKYEKLKNKLDQYQIKLIDSIREII